MVPGSRFGLRIGAGIKRANGFHAPSAVSTPRHSRRLTNGLGSRPARYAARTRGSASLAGCQELCKRTMKDGNRRGSSNRLRNKPFMDNPQVSGSDTPPIGHQVILDLFRTHRTSLHASSMSPILFRRCWLMDPGGSSKLRLGLARALHLYRQPGLRFGQNGRGVRSHRRRLPG